MLTWTEYIETLVAVRGVLDPPGVVPLFLGATAGQAASQRRRTARATAVVVALPLVGTALAGERALHTMGIRIATFREGGGILVPLMAISMMHATVGGSVETPTPRARISPSSARGSRPGRPIAYTRRATRSCSR